MVEQQATRPKKPLRRPSFRDHLSERRWIEPFFKRQHQQIQDRYPVVRERRIKARAAGFGRVPPQVA